MALGQALEAVARPLGLVVRVDGGVVRIVPGGQAAVGSDLAALVATANARPVPQLVGADLGQVVQTLEDATGAAVVLSQRALHSRARVALPEGSTVEAALGLLFGEARLRARWSQLLPEGRLVLTLEQAGAEPLLRALEVLVEGSPLDPANVGAAKALAEARASWAPRSGGSPPEGPRPTPTR